MPIQSTCANCGASFSTYPYRFTQARTVSCSKACADVGRYAPWPERLFRSIDVTTTPQGCHPWMRARDRDGYGVAHRDRRSAQAAGAATLNMRAHRAVWEYHHGPIPAGMQVCHRCDNPPCCRIEHLFLQTGLGNTRDMVGKGRNPHGETHRRAKLSEHDVRAIRARALQGESGRALGRIFGVRQSTIQRITSGQYWKHVG